MKEKERKPAPLAEASGLNRVAADLDGEASALNGKASGLDGKASGLDDKASGLDGKASGLDDKASALNDKASALNDKASGLDGKADCSSGSSADVLGLAAEVGHLLLQNGAEIARVEESMQVVADKFGAKGENFFVLSNGIFTTGRSFANVEYIPIKGTRMDMIVHVNHLVRQIFEDRCAFDQARQKLEDIKNIPAKTVPEQLLGAALGSFAFCAIFGGGIWDCLASLFIGTIAYMFLLLANFRHMSKPLANVCGGLIGTALCIVFSLAGLDTHIGNMMVGSLIPLIPGVPFTNGLRDIANEDYLAGITRLLDALLVFLCIAIGVCVAFLAHSYIAGGMIMLSGTLTDSFTAALPIQMTAALLGTASFAVLFGVPRRFYFTCGLVGMMGWLAYLITVRYTPLLAPGGTFIAATLIAFLSRAAAKIEKCPSTVFLVCGIFPLIPGAGVFWTSYYLVSEQMHPALASGFLAFKVTVAIVLGIIVTVNILKPTTLSSRLRSSTTANRPRL